MNTINRTARSVADRCQPVPYLVWLYKSNFVIVHHALARPRVVKVESDLLWLAIVYGGRSAGMMSNYRRSPSSSRGARSRIVHVACDE